MFDIERLRAHVQEKLEPERYHHSVCVQKQAMHLARLHGADWYAARIAGLVHDVCRCMPHDEQLKYICTHGILLDDFTLQYPWIWHAVAGSVYILRELGITDPSIVAAVRYHTTARAGMSVLEQVVFIADKTSSDRGFPDANKLRGLAEYSLRDCMREVLCHNMAELVAAAKPIVPDTAAAYNEFTLQFKEEPML